MPCPCSQESPRSLLASRCWIPRWENQQNPVPDCNSRASEKFTGSFGSRVFVLCVASGERGGKLREDPLAQSHCDHWKREGSEF